MTAMRHKTDFVHIKRTRNIDEGSKAKNKNSKSVQHYSIGIFTELCLTQARRVRGASRPPCCQAARRGIFSEGVLLLVASGEQRVWENDS
jgi:hypothetical protein